MLNSQKPTKIDHENKIKYYNYPAYRLECLKAEMFKNEKYLDDLEKAFHLLNKHVK